MTNARPFYFLEQNQTRQADIQIPGTPTPNWQTNATSLSAPFDINQVRCYFPTLQERIHGRPRTNRSV